MVNKWKHLYITYDKLLFVSGKTEGHHKVEDHDLPENMDTKTKKFISNDLHICYYTQVKKKHLKKILSGNFVSSDWLRESHPNSGSDEPIPRLV